MREQSKSLHRYGPWKNREMVHEQWQHPNHFTDITLPLLVVWLETQSSSFFSVFSPPNTLKIKKIHGTHDEQTHHHLLAFTKLCQGGSFQNRASCIASASVCTCPCPCPSGWGSFSKYSSSGCTSSM